MKIGILKTGHPPDELRPKIGDYKDVFALFLKDSGFEIAGFDVVDMDFPGQVTDCDGWLITGSRHGVYEDHAFIPLLEDFVRAAFAADVPIVGVCFGHQIIAQAMGGKVEKFAGGWVVGRQTYPLAGETLALNAWHQDQVVALPAGAEVLSSTDTCANAALLYGRQAFTIQPHPEYESPFIADLIRLRGRGTVPDAQLDQATATLEQPNDNPKLARMVVQFFRERSLG